MVDKETHQLAIDWDDEIIAGTCLTRDGKIVHPALAPPEPAAEVVAEVEIGSEAAAPSATEAGEAPAATPAPDPDTPTQEGA